MSDKESTSHGQNIDLTSKKNGVFQSMQKHVCWDLFCSKYLSRKKLFFQSIVGIHFPSSCLEIVDTKTLSDFKYTLAFYSDFCRKMCFICYFRINKKYWKKNVSGKMLSAGKNSTGNVYRKNIDLQVYRKFSTKS